MLFLPLDKRKVKGERALKCVQAPLQEVSSFRKSTLQSQEVSEVNQTLMMVEISLKELDQLVNVHCLLHYRELSLQASVMWSLHKSKHSIL